MKTQVVRIRRALAVLAVTALTLAAQPVPIQAMEEYPSFYATIVGLAPDRSSITVMPSRDQRYTVDVRDLGLTPWNEGAFMLDNVLVIHARHLDGRLVAIGYEQLRNGDEQAGTEGIEPKPPTPRERRPEPRVLIIP